MELNELKRKDLRIGEMLKIPGQAKNNDKSEKKQKDAISELLDKQENKNNKVTLKTKTYSTKSKALEKEAVDYVMKNYPNLMEKLKNN